MTIAAVLLAYAVGAGTLGAGLLARAGWTVRAPLLAILTYLAAAPGAGRPPRCRPSAQVPAVRPFGGVTQVAPAGVLRTGHLLTTIRPSSRELWSGG